MIKRSCTLPAWLALLLAAASLSQALAQGVQVRPADRELFTEEPRQVVALAFTVRNVTGTPVQLEPRLVLPQGWQPIARELPFDLAAGESVTRLTSFVISETALAGEYTVTYEVQDRLQPAIRDSYSVRVNVRAAPKLQPLVLEAPSFAIAGERYKAVFLVRNTGNAAINARFTVRSAQGAKLDPQSGTVALDPGESRNLTIEVLSPEVRRRTSEYLTLSVEAPDAAIKASATAETQVVPRISAEEAYHTLSTRMDVSFIGHEAGDERTSGWLAEWSGTGALDEEQKHQLGFLLRGPDARELGALGVVDEYRIQYWGEAATATLGDYVYGLSLLTEPGRYGRGASIDVARNRWGISAYQAQDRFSARQPRQRGFNAYYQPAPNARLDVNLLGKSGGSRPGAIRSVRGQAVWFGGLNTAVEFAQSSGEGEGEDSQAFQVNVYDSRYAVDYYLFGWRTDPDYLGYLRDEEYWTAGFDYPRADWGLHGYYRLQNHSLLADPLRPAPQERQANLGIDRTLSANTRLGLDYNLRTLADPHAASGLDTANHSARFRLSQSFKNVSTLYTFERGRTANHATGRSFDTALHLLSAYWHASAAQSYGFSASRDKGGSSGAPKGAQTTLGLNASYRLPGALSVSLDVQQNRTPASRYNSYNAWLAHERPNGSRFSLIFRHIEGLLPRTDALLTYSVPFAVPIARRSGVSAVRGRVYDAETGSGVRNVVLNLDGLTAVTSGDGEFSFPAVRAGSYQLSMDRANIGVEQVPQTNLPLEVVVSQHEPQQIEIALVRSITIDVSVTLQGNGTNGMNGADASQNTGVTGAKRILVVLKNGEREYRRLTDAAGRVRLAGLPPGEWVVSISNETVPEGYGVEKGTLAFNIAPGEVSAAVFRLKQITREIKMLPPLEIG